MPPEVEDVSTPHDRATAQIVAALDEMGPPGRTDLARGLQGLGEYEGSTGKGRALLLAAAFSFDELDALRIAVASSPKPRSDWRRHIYAGGHNDGHMRSECLERPGEWCYGIGNHPGRCDSCPTLRSKTYTVTRVLDSALELRREIDLARARRVRDRASGGAA